MTTKRDLQYAIERIAQLTGQATTRTEAENKGLDRYLQLDYSSVYGGYRVVSVLLRSGAHYGALGMSSIETRLKAKEMFLKLQGIEYGIEYQNKVHI